MFSNVGKNSGVSPTVTSETPEDQSTKKSGGADKRASTTPLDNTRRSTTTSLQPRVSILGFASDVSLIDGTPPGFPTPHPYRVTGHVGVSTDGGKTIFGFGPNAPGMSTKQVFDKLIARETFPGKVTDDTQVFKSVHESPQVVGSQSHDSQIVYKKDIPVSSEQLAAINAKIQEHMSQHELPQIRYGFPFPNTTARNCATYPAELGIPLPHARGNISVYVPALKNQGEEWNPPA